MGKTRYCPCKLLIVEPSKVDMVSELFSPSGLTGQLVIENEATSSSIHVVCHKPWPQAANWLGLLHPQYSQNPGNLGLGVCAETAWHTLWPRLRRPAPGRFWCFPESSELPSLVTD